MRAASPQGRPRAAERLAGSPASTLSTPPNRAAFRHLGRLSQRRRHGDRRGESKTAGPARSRPTGQAHCAFVESGGEPKDARAIFANHRHVGEMAANIFATAVGPNLAPVWLGHRLPLVGHSFWLRSQTSSETRGAKRFSLDSHLQTGNACDPLRAGEAPKRVIITGMTVKTGRLTD